MARIALIAGAAIAGAAISVATGGLGTFAVGAWAADIIAGASVGASAGSMLGAALLPTKIANNPPLNDLQVQSSAPGNPIPYGFGSYRIAGNVIWASLIKETTTQSTAGGKGGPTSNVYSYTVNLAISFGYGPGTITRIWADAKLIYDVTGKGAIAIDTGLTSGKSGTAVTTPFNPRIYNGSSTQDPDPTIQAALGVDQTPGFRDQIYMLLEDFPLADYGDRIPSFRAEITQSTELAYIEDIFPPSNVTGLYSASISPPFFTYVDPIHRVAYIFSEDMNSVQAIDLDANDGEPVDPWAPNTVTQLNDQVLDSNGNVELAVSVTGDQKTGNGSPPPTWATGETVTTSDNHVGWENVGPGPNAVPIIRQGAIKASFDVSSLNDAGEVTCVDTAGNLWVQMQAQSGQWYFVKFDPVGFAQGSGPITTTPQASAVPMTSPVQGATVVKSASSGKNYIFCVCQSAPTLVVIDADAAAIVSSGSWLAPGAGANLDQSCPIVDPATGTCYVLSHDNATPNAPWVNIVNVLTGTTTMSAFSIAPNQGNGNQKAIGGVWNASDKTLLLFTTAGTAGDGDVWKVDPSSGSVIAASTTGIVDMGSGLSNIFTKGYNGIAPSSGTIKLLNEISGVITVVYVDCATLEVEQAIPLSNWMSAGASLFSWFAFDPITDSAVVTAATGAYGDLSLRIYFDRQQVAMTPLGDALASLWAKTGADPSLLDTSLVSGLSIRGYPITQVANPKGLIPPLATAYFFDLVESDNVLKAIPRGQSVSTIIPEADLGIAKDGFELIPTVVQQNDLPLVVTLNYSDPNLDYQQAKQMYQRNKRVKRTRNESNISIPLTLETDEAAAIAARILAITWAEKNNFELKLWRAGYLIIDPSDVVQFTYNGNPYQARILKGSAGVDFILEITGVSEDPRQYALAPPGTSITGFVSGTIVPLGPTVLFILDTPYIADTDDGGSNTGYYYLMSTPLQNQWPGGVLYTSLDNADFTAKVSDTVAASFGTVVDATPNASPAVWDDETVINVRMAMGTLSSDTDINVLDGSNRFFLGGELMAFGSASLQADGSYNLSHFLRGLRGTEGQCGTHIAGETLIILDGGKFRNGLPPSYVGQLQYFRGTTIGSPVASGTSQQITLQGNDLKPYAPCHMGGSRDGSLNLTITWTRRTRIGGEQDWLDGVTDVPLSEASELYSVDILNGSTVVRTFNGLTSPTVEYTSAEQVTDFGSDQSAVSINVYQISEVVGRGFAGSATV